MLVSPAVAPRLLANEGDSNERRIAQRLSQSLGAARYASERAVGGDWTTFSQSIGSGVSANLCEAVAGLVDSVDRFDVSFSSALARPTSEQSGPVSFSKGDAPLLLEAARTFRSLEPVPDQQLHGFVYSLSRPYEDDEGTIRLRAHAAGRQRSVSTTLNRIDYPRAIEAHASGAMVSLAGDLEQVGHHRYLRQARLLEVLPPPESTQPPLLSDFLS